MVAATRSGAGKTTLTIGMLAALTRRGLKVQSFKCGPDFIDPTLHTLVTGRTSYNLDLKMMGETGCRTTFYRHAESADVSVVEGVMGLYDGGSASTAALAKLLSIPVVLIVDAQSSAESCVAVLKGFQEYDSELQVCGVIFNRIGSIRHQQLIADEVSRRADIPVIGHMPRDAHFEIPERHLGLHMGSENPLSDTALDRLSDSIEHHLDMDSLLVNEIKAVSALSQGQSKAAKPVISPKLDLAVAVDRAFSFYYKENFELLEDAGFRLRPFSPLQDNSIPRSCRLVYFGGGYPELFAAQLSANRAMLDSIKDMHEHGVTLYGECGGFMYLCKQLIDMDGREHRMADIFPFTTVMNKRLRTLGYRSVRLLKDSFFGSSGDRLHGHEFHYSHLQEDYSGTAKNLPCRLYRLDDDSPEGYRCGSAFGSYIHLHFGRNPETADYMYKQLL